MLKLQQGLAKLQDAKYHHIGIGKVALWNLALNKVTLLHEFEQECFKIYNSVSIKNDSDPDPLVKNFCNSESHKICSKQNSARKFLKLARPGMGLISWTRLGSKLFRILSLPSRLASQVASLLTRDGTKRGEPIKPAIIPISG